MREAHAYDESLARKSQKEFSVVDDLKKGIIGDFKEIKKIGLDIHKEPGRIKENFKLKMTFDEMGRPRPKSAYPFGLSGCFRQDA